MTEIFLQGTHSKGQSRGKRMKQVRGEPEEALDCQCIRSNLPFPDAWNADLLQHLWSGSVCLLALLPGILCLLACLTPYLTTLTFSCVCVCEHEVGCCVWFLGDCGVIESEGDDVQFRVKVSRYMGGRTWVNT